MNESQIFTNALKLATPAERAAYLDEACADNPQLRADVEALLRAQAGDTSFLEQPVGGMVGTVDLPADPGSSSEPPLGATGGLSAPEGGDSAPAESAGMLLAGRYKLLEELGEGGMGTVWMAQQIEPVKRLVAVKLIKSGMDSKAVLARFDAERQALALMDHPNIAKVHDAGTTGDCEPRALASGEQPPLPHGRGSGRPFFVMELVKGVPITQFCDERRLTPRQRLELFVPVCQAIQHAHQKGIIHRDLKPSNVLVALYDDRPVPKVIDFGVAKATGQQLTEQTLHTGFGAVVGTVEYMSPEQASFNQLDVDTRSDIYALGVLLYELLTGSPPIGRQELEKAGMLEMLRLIREKEPAKPSTRLSTAEALPSLAANRGTEPKRLTALMRGEIDWIVMKALEKDRARRYETANGFAADVQRYLGGEPVQAVPPSAGYRLRKFVRRNKGPVLAGVVVLVALLAGVIGTTVGMWQAVTERNRATQLAEDKTQLAEEKSNLAIDLRHSLVGEERQRKQAEENLLRSERLLYASQIGRAQQYWDDVNVEEARDQLNATRSDFRGWEYRYLYSVFNNYQRTFKGHTHNVLRVAFSADGKRLATCSWDKTVKLWDVESANELITLQGHTDGIYCMAFSADGKRIATGSEDTTIKIWDSERGRELLTLKGHTRAVVSLAFSPDSKRLASGSTDESVKVWDTERGQELFSLKGNSWVYSVAFSPDGKRLAGGGQREASFNTVKVWDAENGQEVLSFKGHRSTVHSVVFSPDGRILATGGGAGNRPAEIRFWDVKRGQELFSINVLTAGEVRSLAFDPDGKQLASGQSDKTVKLWHVGGDSLQEITTLKGHTRFVNSVAFSPDGKQLASGSDDKTVKVWDIEEARTASPSWSSHSLVRSVAFSPEGKQLASAHKGEIRVWDVKRGQEVCTLELPTFEEIHSVTFSPDGKFLASGNSDKTVRLWDVVRLQEFFIRSRDTIQYADRNQRRKLLQAFCVHILKGHTDKVLRVAFSPDGKRLASGSADGTVKLWDAEQGHELLTFKGHTGPVNSIAYSPDSKRLASGSADGTAKVWDAATGQEAFTLEGHTKGVISVGFSPDGAKLATVNRESTTVKVWDANRGQELFILRGHISYVYSAGFSPDGRRIATGSNDKTIKVWDAERGQELLALRYDQKERDNRNEAAVIHVACSPDGRRLARVSYDHKIKIYDAGPPPQAEAPEGKKGA